MMTAPEKALFDELGALLRIARNELDVHADALQRLDSELRAAMLYAQDLEGTFDVIETTMRNLVSPAAAAPTPPAAGAA